MTEIELYKYNKRVGNETYRMVHLNGALEEIIRHRRIKQGGTALKGPCKFLIEIDRGFTRAF